MNTFKIAGVEYYISKNPHNGCPMVARVDGRQVDNRKDVCRKFLRLHNWTTNMFGSKTTQELEREVNKILNKDEIIGKEYINPDLNENVNNNFKEPKKKAINKEFTVEMVQKVLEVLSKKDHLFVSEAHLQTEFIIETAKLYPDYLYYPELVPNNIPVKYLQRYGENGIHFDLIVKTKNDVVLFEFKYITESYSEIVNGVDIKVKSHVAMDVRRYDCWKDISRIELFSEDASTNVSYGYFILITNVSRLWKNPINKTYDLQFQLNNGLHPKGIKRWDESASKGTIKGREEPLYIDNDYSFGYKDFYKSDKDNGTFKSLVVPIGD